MAHCSTPKRLFGETVSPEPGHEQRPPVVPSYEVVRMMPWRQARNILTVIQSPITRKSLSAASAEIRSLPKVTRSMTYVIRIYFGVS